MSPRIHLIAPAGSCRSFFERLGLRGAAEFTARVQDYVGGRFRVTADEALLDASENEALGGRDDDARRAADIQSALADSDVAALILVRGGAWFTRILPRIDFGVLSGRTAPVALFGFSELTPLVNLVAAHAHGRGVYDFGPAFFTYGLTRYAARRADATFDESTAPERWAQAQLEPHLRDFFEDVVRMITGRGSTRALSAELVAGELPERSTAVFVGGNLTVLSTMVGSLYDAAVRPAGRWIFLEDYNDKLERFDRFLAHLTLAGYWDEAGGLLLGDFHQGERDLLDGVRALLAFHLPAERTLPILVSRTLGHTWPMSPLPLNLPLTLERTHDRSYTLHWPAEALRTVAP